MHRFMKLGMAGVALALLAAGFARRWAKEHHVGVSDLPQMFVSGQAAHGERLDETTGVMPASYANPERVVPATANLPYRESFPENSAPNAGVDSAAYAVTQPTVAAAPVDYWPPTNYAPDGNPNDPPPAVGQPSAYEPPTNSPGYYVVQPNDSFWTISQRVYGTGRYFHALYEHNRRLCPQPDRLPAGAAIETPEPYILEQAYPQLFR